MSGVGTHLCLCFPAAVPAPSAEMIKAKDPGMRRVLWGYRGCALFWPCTQYWHLSPTLVFVPSEPQYFRFEGVWLTETGMAVLRNLTLSPLHKRRQRKGRPGALNGDGGLEGSDPLGPEDKKDGDLDTDELLKAEGGCCRWESCGVAVWGCQGTPLTRTPLAVGVEHMECEIKLEAPASPDRDVGADGDSGKGLEDPEECKKRKRKPYRPGECPAGPEPFQGLL